MVAETDEEDSQVDKPYQGKNDRTERYASALPVVWFRPKNPGESEKYLQQ